MTDPDSSRQARFCRVAWPHLAMLTRVACVLTDRRADAEDLVQDTMLKAFRFLDRFEEGTDARAWLLTVMRNTRIDQVRAAHRRGLDRRSSLSAPGPEPAAPLAVAAPPEDAAQDPDAWLEYFNDDDMVAALRRLSDDARWTLLLLDVEGLSVAETATVMRVAPGTVKSRAGRARARLRDELSAPRLPRSAAGLKHGETP